VPARNRRDRFILKEFRHVLSNTGQAVLADVVVGAFGSGL
jgi:hypothetical protein